MTRLIADLSISLDGYVAGPHPTLDKPLGEGGERLHGWAFKLKSFRAPHGLEGGEVNADDEVVAEALRAEGAVIMGRRMFSGGEGPWERDPNARGWWGEHPPFGVPVFVLTQHQRDPLSREPRSRSLRTGSNPRSSRLAAPRARRTSSSAAGQASSGST